MGDCDFGFVEAVGLFADFTIEVKMIVKVPVGGSAIIAAGRIARGSFVVDNPMQQPVFA